MATVLVTGATAGFGRAIAVRLIDEGHKVIATGRRQERLDEMAKTLGPRLLPYQLDVTDSAANAALPANLPPDFAAIDVLINNAGLALGAGKAIDSAVADWQTMIATNVRGMVEITHAMLPGMIARNAGYIMAIGSTAGTYPYMGGNVYCGTKAFVDQFMQSLRADLLGTRIRASVIAPGLCGGSEFSNVRLRDDDKAAAVYRDTTPLSPEDIAETVSWLMGLPLHMNVNHIEMMPLCQASGGLAVDRTLGRI